MLHRIVGQESNNVRWLRGPIQIRLLLQVTEHSATNRRNEMGLLPMPEGWLQWLLSELLLVPEVQREGSGRPLCRRQGLPSVAPLAQLPRHPSRPKGGHGLAASLGYQA